MPWWSIFKSKPTQTVELTQRSVPPIIADLLHVLLKDADHEARRATATALAERAKTDSAESAEAFDALLLGLEAVDIATAGPAARALGALNESRAVKPLVRRLLKCAPGSALHKQIVDVLSRMVEAGDPRVVRLLRVPGKDAPEATRLPLPLVAAAGAFGNADMLETLVVFARHKSGEEDEVTFEDGHPAYLSASLLAIQALEHILERDAERASTEALQAALELQGLTYQPFPHSEHDRYRDMRDEIDCSKVHRLAQRELMRRGITT
ncbi:MAG TPA: hypothetical protein VGW38_28860 [Chloroflexota bacterium]|nr:hypothetical protein [Chloroflexota bacterium]